MTLGLDSASNGHSEARQISPIRTKATLCDLVTAWRYSDAAERLDPQRDLLLDFYAERTAALESGIEIGGYRANDLSRAREALRVGQVQRAIALAQRAIDFDLHWPEARGRSRHDA